MSNWASKFKDKHELRRGQYKQEIAQWDKAICEHVKEILAGAPLRDHCGVRDLKNSLEIAHREKAKIERRLAKMENTGK